MAGDFDGLKAYGMPPTLARQQYTETPAGVPEALR